MQKFTLILFIFSMTLSAKADLTPQINGDSIYCMDVPIHFSVSNDSGVISESWMIYNETTDTWVLTDFGNTIDFTLSFAADYQAVLISEYDGFYAYTYFPFRVQSSPQILLTSDFSHVACSDTFITLTPAGGNYYWLYNNSELIDSGSAFHVKSSGNYFVTGTNGSCTGGSEEIAVIVETAPVSICVANHFPILGDTLESNSVAICGGSVSLQWEITFQSIEGVTDFSANWSNGANSVNSGLVSPGNYTCNITSSNGCVYNMNTINVALVPLAAPKLRITGTQGAPVLKVSTTSYAIDYYQWYKGNSEISGANNSTFKPTSSGKYSLHIISGACSAKSRSVNVVLPGQKLDEEIVGQNEIISYKIFDITGRLVSNNSDQLNAGMYVVSALYSDNSVQVRKWNKLPGSKLDITLFFQD